MNMRNYFAVGFAVWLMLHAVTGKGALLELAVLLLLWPLVAAAALVIGLMCWAASVREWILKRWRKDV